MKTGVECVQQGSAKAQSIWRTMPQSKANTRDSSSRTTTILWRIQHLSTTGIQVSWFSNYIHRAHFNYHAIISHPPQVFQLSLIKRLLINTVIIRTSLDFSCRALNYAWADNLWQIIMKLLRTAANVSLANRFSRISVQISQVPGPISVSGGGLPGSYIFDQAHFHWASEHLINNGRWEIQFLPVLVGALRNQRNFFFLFFAHRYALELHIVHHEKRFDTITKAAQEKNGIAVLGVLFHVSMKPNPMIEKILYNAGTVFEAVGRNQTYKDNLYLLELLPKNKNSYFRYEGSLTTPNCGEAVVWTVFEESIPISLDQVIFLK